MEKIIRFFPLNKGIARGQIITLLKAIGLYLGVDIVFGIVERILGGVPLIRNLLYHGLRMYEIYMVTGALLCLYQFFAVNDCSEIEFIKKEDVVAFFQNKKYLVIIVVMVIALCVIPSGKSMTKDTNVSSNETEISKDNSNVNIFSQNENDNQISPNYKEVVTNTFWDDLEIYVNGYEIILNETTAEDMENAGLSYSFENEKNILEGYNVTTFENGEENIVRFRTNQSVRYKKGEDVLPLIYIGEVTIEESEIGEPDAVTIGGITVNANETEIVEAFGVPDYFTCKEWVEHYGSYQWYYYNTEKNLIMRILFSREEEGDRDIKICVGENSVDGRVVAEMSTYFDGGKEFVSGSEEFNHIYGATEEEQRLQSEEELYAIEKAEQLVTEGSAPNEWEKMHFSIAGTNITVGSGSLRGGIYGDSRWVYVGNESDYYLYQPYQRIDEGDIYSALTVYGGRNGNIGAAWFSAGEGIEFSIPGGITQDSTAADVRAVYGTPDYFCKNGYYYVSDDYTKVMGIELSDEGDDARVLHVEFLDGMVQYWYSGDLTQEVTYIGNYQREWFENRKMPTVDCGYLGEVYRDINGHFIDTNFSEASHITIYQE